MTFQKLINLRTDLNSIDYIATITQEIPDTVIGLVRKKIQNLSVLRLEIFKYSEPEFKKPIEPVKIREPKIASPTRTKRISSNTSYNPERYIPYKILWAKVIIRAAYDYALWKDAKDFRLKKYAQEAEQWIFESSSLELGFENICFAFDFPVERIRARTRALTKDDVKKLEFRERHGRGDVIGEFQSDDNE